MWVCCGEQRRGVRWREGKKEWKGMWEEGKEKEKNTRDGGGRLGLLKN